MNLLYFIVFSLLVFLSLLLGGKKYRSTALYALAIGGIVNANFFHAGNYPFDIFGIPFGIDSTIYTLFIFCVIIMFIQDGLKQAYILSFSSIIAIMFSALMQLVAQLLSNGSSLLVWKEFLGFVISSFASVVTVVVMLSIINKLKTKNHYWVLTLGIVLATIINTFIYYPLITILYGIPSNIFDLLIGSVVGKTIAIGCSVLTLFLLKLYDKRCIIKNRSKNEESI